MKNFKDFICEKIGHKWTYFRLGTQDLRACKRCHRLQHKMVISSSVEFWTFTVQYTDKGAKENVKGYGK